MNKITESILLYIVISTLIALTKFSIDSLKFMNINKKNLSKIYGKNSWIVITGASSGQGKDYSIEFAKKGFNILMIGSDDCFHTQKIINRKYPNVKTKVIVKDFCLSYEKDFFNDINKFIENNNVSGLVSNIGYRFGVEPYHKIDDKKIIDIISAKAITQSIMIKIALNKFIKKKNHKSFIIVISALVKNKSSIYDSDNINTLPFLSIYESVNAYSFFHAKTLFEEFKTNPMYKNIDYLNITPAGVITSNTKYFLNNVPFSVKSKYFVKSSIGLLNNFNGISCGCFEHLIAYYLPSILPIKFLKNKIEFEIGKNIAQHY